VQVCSVFLNSTSEGQTLKCYTTKKLLFFVLFRSRVKRAQARHAVT